MVSLFSFFFFGVVSPSPYIFALVIVQFGVTQYTVSTFPVLQQITRVERAQREKKMSLSLFFTFSAMLGRNFSLSKR